MRRALQLLRRLAAVALIPLSIVPVAAALPQVEDEYRDFAERYLEREALPAPDLRLSHLYWPVRVPGTRVPVLAYHGIEQDGSPYSVSREAFARQMSMLDQAGFETIGIEDYARWARGEAVRLPKRPILLTFDDGRLDSFRGADAVLEEHGFKAVMFAIAGNGNEQGTMYSTWDELRAMANSGRWDVQFHAGRGHRQVPVGRRGRHGPFYANRIWREEGTESYGAARRRILGDLSWGIREFRRQLPGFRQHAFAVPFGDFGQHQTNEPRIRRMLRRWMTREFDVSFIQSDDPPFSRRRAKSEIVQRYEVARSTSLGALYAWLSRYGGRVIKPLAPPGRLR